MELFDARCNIAIPLPGEAVTFGTIRCTPEQRHPATWGGRDVWNYHQWKVSSFDNNFYLKIMKQGFCVYICLTKWDDYCQVKIYNIQTKNFKCR